MSNDTPKQTPSRFARAALIGLAAMVVGLGVPGLLSAAETIPCNALLIAAPPLRADAQLGWSLSLDGEWLAAGANQDKTKGSVALYRNPQPGDQPVLPDQEIAPTDLQSGDQFGSSVSISNGWLAVGAPVGDGKVQDSGVVYLFKLVESTWIQQVKLDATDAAKGAQFGFSVSLNKNILVVGAPGDSTRGSSAGAAYIFEKVGDADWKQMPKLVANDGRPFDEFGSSVAVAIDKAEIVVGAPFADDFHVFQNFGAAYVFQRNGGWSLEDNGKLTAGVFRPGNIQFGSAVAIGGGWIVVGARGDDQGLTDSGSAYVFDRNGLSHTPSLLRADDPKQSAQFGTSIQIDKDHILIGAPFDASNVGAAYLFEKQSATIWLPKFKFLHTPGGAFGQSVAILDKQVFMGGFEFTLGDATHAGAVATCSIPPSQGNPHLTCTKTGPESVDAGGLATYKITVTNDGDTAVTGVMLNDSTPAGLTFVRADRPCNKGFPCSLGTIPAGTPVSKEVTFQAPEGCSARGTFTNSAIVTGDGVDAATCKSLPTTILSLPQKPFLRCDKQVIDPVGAGGVINYKITVSNTGCAMANNVELSDPTPPGLIYMSGPCVQSPCNLGTIGPGQPLPPVMLSFKVQVPAGCAAPLPITNMATVTGSNAVQQTCSLVTSVPAPPSADLKVSVSNPPTPSSPVSGGDSFKLSAVVTNAGPDTAQDATADVFIGSSAIIDSVPAGCSVVNPQLIASQPIHFSCLLGDLSSGGSKPLDFMVRAPACAGCSAGSPIDFTVEAMSKTCDPTLPNRAMATVQVTCLPVNHLTITKTDNPDPVVPGQAVLYTITVKNTGASAVSGAVVRDDFPSELRKVLWCRGAGCTPSSSPPLEDTIDLAAGETRIYRLSGIVRPMCSGVLHNKATVTPPAGVCDDPSDNQALEDTQVVATGVHAFCEEISGPMMELTPITKTLLLINCGPANQGDNPGDEFTDTLPAGLTLTGASATSGVASTSGNTATWNGAIPAGGSVTITINANINAGTTGMILCNQATIAYDADGNGTNESIGFSDDPDEPGPADPCCFRVIAPGIPTLSGDSLAAFALLLAGLAIMRLRRRPL
ncbi:MAG: IPTL-CTERM sorting domain-containing protein [Thermoanaerobaculia bacterium]